MSRATVVEHGGARGPRPWGEPYAIAVLFGINFMNFSDRQVAGALGEPIRIQFGLNDTKPGLLAMVFTLFMAASPAMTLVYHSTVYSAIQDVVEPRLRGTAVSLCFFAMYVFGASSGSTIMGPESDYFANREMPEAGATGMAMQFRAAGCARPCT